MVVGSPWRESLPRLADSAFRVDAALYMTVPVSPHIRLFFFDLQTRDSHLQIRHHLQSLTRLNGCQDVGYQEVLRPKRQQPQLCDLLHCGIRFPVSSYLLLTYCRSMLILRSQALRIRPRCDGRFARPSQFRQILPFNRHIAERQLGPLALHSLDLSRYRGRLIQLGLFLRRSIHYLCR